MPAHAGYSTFLVIPIGLGLALLIKLLSDSAYFSGIVCINTAEYPLLEDSSWVRDRLSGLAKQRQQANDRTFMKGGMPIFMEEILGRRARSIYGHMEMLCSYHGIGLAHEGMLILGQSDDYRPFRERMAYEHYMTHGDAKATTLDSPFDCAERQVEYMCSFQDRGNAMLLFLWANGFVRSIR